MRDRHDRTFEVEFLLAGGVVHAPVGAHRAFVTGLPRLVERFDDEIVVAPAVQGVDQVTQVNGLIGRAGICTAAHAAVAWPANFRQQQWFFREQLFQVPGTVQYEFTGLVHRDKFPVRQDVRGNQVYVLGQLRVFLPNVPLLGRGHGHFDGCAHPVEQHDQLFGGDLFTEQGFVADHHAYNAA